jgi:hypothetical protein
VPPVVASTRGIDPMRGRDARAASRRNVREVRKKLQSISGRSVDDTVTSRRGPAGTILAPFAGRVEPVRPA